MDEKLETRREVVVYDIVQQWDVYASCRQIRHNQIIHFLLTEQRQPLISGVLIHRTVDECRLQGRLPADLVQELDMMPRGGKNDRLVILRIEIDELLHDEQ